MFILLLPIGGLIGYLIGKSEADKKQKLIDYIISQAKAKGYHID